MFRKLFLSAVLIALTWTVPAFAQAPADSASLFSLKRVLVTAGVDHAWAHGDSLGYANDSPPEKEFQANLNAAYSFGDKSAVIFAVSRGFTSQKFLIRVGYRIVLFSGL